MSTTSSTGQLVALSDLIPNTHTATTRISTTLHNGTSSFVVVLAIPGRREGQVQIVELAANHIPDQDGGNSPSSSNPPTPSTTLIQAHSSSLACLALSRNGHLLASASERGTIIRLFDARSGKLMAELRRGMDQAFIYSLAFDSSAERLCVASDKGTVHIFNLFEQQEQSQISSNQYSSYSSSSSSSTGNITAAAANIQQQLIQGGRQTLNFLSPYMPKYFNSQWSFAQFSMPSSSSDYKCVCAFYEPDEKKSSNGAGGDSFISSPSSSMDQLHATHHHRPIVIILCWDGTCSAISFDAKSGGECRRESFERFMPIGQGGVGAGEMGVNGYTSGSSLASTPKTRSSTSAKAPVSSISNTTDSSSLRSPSSMKQQQNQQPISKQQTASSSATTKSTSMTSSSTCHTSSSSTSPPLKAPPPFAKTVTTSPSRIAINPEDLLFEPPIVSSFSAKQHKQNHPPQPPPPPSSSSSSTQKLEDSQGSSGEFDIDTLNQEQLEQILKETKTGGEKKRNKGKGKAAADSHFGVDDDEDDWLS